VYGNGQRRVDRTLVSRPDMQVTRLLMHRKQIEVFKKLVPNNVAKWQ
jgi:dynactin-6